ncbi:MAG: hypothetical protein ACO34J_07265 [Prochlorothrix sp.]
MQETHDEESLSLEEALAELENL